MKAMLKMLKNNSESLSGGMQPAAAHHFPQMYQQKASLIGGLDLTSSTVGLSPILAYYQPQIWVATGELYGAESLARWHHEKGVLGPEHFLPLLNSPRLRNALWERMLNHSLEMLQQMRGKNLCISVNVCADIASSEMWAEQILRELEKREINAANLTIEITEGVERLPTKGLSRAIGRLRKHGVKCAIDDFGTGYSSLQRLAESPFSTLKIDKSFVHLARTNDKGKKILRNAICMARDLDLLVIAEGIESEEDLERVSELGADIVQGYYCAKPMAPAEFVTYVQARNIKAELMGHLRVSSSEVIAKDLYIKITSCITTLLDDNLISSKGARRMEMAAMCTLKCALERVRHDETARCYGLPYH